MEFDVTNKFYLVLFLLPNIPTFLIFISAIVVAIRNFIVKVKKAKTVKDVVEAGNELNEELATATNNEKFLAIKEYCREAIYSKERLFKNVVGKNGAIKLDSVLNAVQLECVKQGYEYDEATWVKYINTEVAQMKEVK